MLSSTDADAYISEFRSRLQKDNSMPGFLKSVRQAEMFVALGRHSESIEYFQEALKEIDVEDYIWRDVYLSTAGLYAFTLDVLGDLIGAENMYKQILHINPTDFCIGDYAIFLHRRKRDFPAAQKYYLQSLQLYPQHASMHLKYAGFLRHVMRDNTGAETHYRMSVECGPEYADGLGGYASFLHGTGGDSRLAEQLYEKSVEVDTTHVNNFCNYGLFLSEEVKNYEKAEQMYRKALETSPRHANTLYNYAVMLDSHLQRKKEAEELYRQCIDAEPRHSFALYNLAVLREEMLRLRPPSDGWQEKGAALSEEAMAGAVEVRRLYQRAVEADPRDATSMADCGRFIADKMRDPEAGEPLLRAALKIDPQNDVAALHLGVIALRYKRNFTEAVEYFRDVLGRKPGHTACMHQLARALIEIHNTGDVYTGASLSNTRRGSSTRVSSGQPPQQPSQSPLDEAFSLFERTAEGVKEPGAVLFEYIDTVAHSGAPKHKLRAVVFVESALDKVQANAFRSDISNILAKIKG